eukprot:CAMPEP_0113638334 /NCGR_PEP_ID=MMETSP0017_2-20120614/20075_1 /TAXON_ID=2856 /ORGANISM="Cylindrotheca closterium" /LENGTH=543 /DNA_ID=CAMNT_0000549423 /DNA_START=88 /DNA_END=1719 /DNA_ORIENTATION=- /assembly_acc=CAM_ASM_000147
MKSIVPSLLSCSVLVCAILGNVEGFVTPSTNLQTEIWISRNNLIKPNTANRRRSNQIVLQSFSEDEDPLIPNGDAEATIDYTKMKPQVYSQRWVQLAYLSLLALLSDWVCFSVAAAPDAFEQSFGHSASSIIDIFLFTNVATSFLVTDVVTNFGMQKAIQSAAVLMALGCWLRAGVGFLPGQDGLVDYTLLVIGTVLVGVAQPFFQCTPPLLSATWFANNERSTSTAIALNFNQIGIATAFLVGGSMATTTKGLENYLGLIALATTIITVGTLLQFENAPPIPPSASELEKKIKGEVEPPFLESVQKFFNTRGFTNALAAFICSISITNVVGAFIDDVMTRGGVTGQFQIDLAGAGFELAIVLGGIVLGGYVDRTKDYKIVTMGCLAATAFFVLPLGLTDHALGREPLLMVAALLGLGVAAGPVQPINAELAVDVTYPGDETAVESVQQIGGNLISALLIPIAEKASESDYTLLKGVPGFESDIRGDVVLLVAIAFITLAYFSKFDAPLMRSAADEGSEEESEFEEEDDAVINVDSEELASQV